MWINLLRLESVPLVLLVVSSSNGLPQHPTPTLHVSSGGSFPSSCDGNIQANLKYNASDQPNDTPGAKSAETLADSICCDTTFGHAYAEPPGFFAQVRMQVNAAIAWTF